MLILDLKPSVGWPWALWRAQTIENPFSIRAYSALGLAVEL